MPEIGADGAALQLVPARRGGMVGRLDAELLLGGWFEVAVAAVEYAHASDSDSDSVHLWLCGTEAFLYTLQNSKEKSRGPRISDNLPLVISAKTF